MNINLENYEEYALDYLEGSLPLAEKEAFQTFLLLHPAIQAELADMEIVKLQPDLGEVFSSREQLYRKNSTALYWVGLGAALVLSVIFFNPSKIDTAESQPQLVKTDQPQVQPNVPPLEKTINEHSYPASSEAERKDEISEKVRVATEEPTSELSAQLNPIDKKKAVEDVPAFDGQQSLDVKKMQRVSEASEVLQEERQQKPFRLHQKSLRKLEPVRSHLIPTKRHPAIEVIHPSLLEQYSRLLEDGEAKGKFGQWVVQTSLVPKAFKSEKNSTWKERLLPDYITAE